MYMRRLKRYMPILNKKSMLLIMAAILLAISVVAFKNIFFIALLIVLAVFSKLPEIAYRSINTDMTMFVLVVLGTAYGVPFGLFIALAGFYAALTLKTLVAKHMAPEKLVVPPLGYLIAGTLAMSMGYDVFVTGIMAVAIYASIMVVAYGLIYGFQMFDVAVYISTIIAFNYFLFSNFAPLVVAVLKV
jgi:hypothetical protein